LSAVATSWMDMQRSRSSRDGLLRRIGALFVRDGQRGVFLPRATPIQTRFDEHGSSFTVTY
ncbi:MAG TPA: hypothetical protein VF792_05260, partial [Ktedonobacterales bacterium]